MLTAGCRAEPALQGQPLRCEEGGCPEGLRCIDDLCLNNTLPRIQAFSARQVVIGDTFELTPEVTDPDPDELTYSWVQQEGPTVVLPEPSAEPTLSFEAKALGLYVFELTVADGYGEPQSQNLAVTVINRPPQITGEALVFAQLNTPVTLTVMVTDPDGHPFTTRWTQVVGPPLLSGAAEGLTLQITPPQVGLYRFEVVADDDYRVSDAFVVDVVVEAEPGSLYVNQRGGEDGPHCGTFLTPCATVSAALASTAAGASPTVVVAAADDPYLDCVTVEAGQRVRGSFDPVDWSYDASRRGATELRCDAPQGHRVSGDGASLEDITLASSVTVATRRPVTVHVGAGTPAITGVDVRGAPCSDGCSPIGVLSDQSSARFTDVEISAEVAAFASVPSFVGLLAWGGAPVFTSSAAARAPNDHARGSVTLNALADQSATGILALYSDLSLDRIAVRGGLGPILSGVAALGSTVTINDSWIELTAFGTTSFAGISSQDCTATEPACACPAEVMDCGKAPAPDAPGILNVAGSGVVLTGGTGTAGFVPCYGAGVHLVGDVPQFTLRDNIIHLQGAFALGAGVLAEFPAEASAAAGGALLAGNQVRVEDGRFTTVCELLGEGLPGLRSGNFGLLLQGGSGVRVEQNQLDVGAHQAVSLGLYMSGGSGAQVLDNAVAVGAITSATLTPYAWGVRLDPPSAGSAGEFARNAVWLGEGVAEGVALTLSDATFVEQAQALPAAWTVRNNVVSGGEARYGVGLELVTRDANSQWPRIYHNTVVGGGLSSESLTSTALRLAWQSDNDLGAPPSVGRLAHNLLDAGDAPGRRFLVDNLTVGGWAAASNNLAQFWGTIPGTLPGAVVSSARAIVGGVVDANTSAGWLVLWEGAGELVGVRQEITGLVLGASTRTYGRPLSVWHGANLGVPYMVMTFTDGAVGVTEVRGAQPGLLTRHALRSSEGVDLQPTEAALGYANLDLSLDLIFLAPDPTGAWRLWTALGSGSGFGAASPQLSLTSPAHLEVGPLGRTIYVLDNRAGEATVVTAQVGSDSTDTIPFSDFVSPAPALSSIAQFDVVYFQEANGQGAPDFIYRTTAGEVGVVLSKDQGFVRATFIAAPCGGGPATAAAVADILSDGTPALLLGCDGATGYTVEVYRLSATSFTLVDTQSVGAEVYGMAVQKGLVENQLLLTQRAAGRLEMYTFSSLVDAFVNSVGGTAALDILADVISRDAQGHPQYAYDGASTDLTVVDDGDAPAARCQLRWRAGGALHDYHLSPEPNACVDAVDRSAASEAELSTLEDDIDGTGTRTDGMLDLGADEL